MNVFLFKFDILQFFIPERELGSQDMNNGIGENPIRKKEGHKQYFVNMSLADKIIQTKKVNFTKF